MLAFFYLLWLQESNLTHLETCFTADVNLQALPLIGRRKGGSHGAQILGNASQDL